MVFGEPHRRKFPELLAAYADGELNAADRAEVDAWLAAHPAARELLESQRRLSRQNRRLWRAAAAPQPGEAGWAKVFGRVRDVLDAPPERAPASTARRRSWRILAPALATAAAAMVAVYLTLPGAGPVPAPLPQEETGERIVLASTADIDIISMDDRDTGNLLVGVPPLPGKIILAAADDVRLRHVQKDADGMMPKVQMNEAGLAPMIIAPIAGR